MMTSFAILAIIVGGIVIGAIAKQFQSKNDNRHIPLIVGVCFMIGMSLSGVVSQARKVDQNHVRTEITNTKNQIEICNDTISATNYQIAKMSQFQFDLQRDTPKGQPVDMEQLEFYTSHIHYLNNQLTEYQHKLTNQKSKLKALQRALHRW